MVDTKMLINRLYERAFEESHAVCSLTPDQIVFSGIFNSNKILCYSLFRYVPFSSGIETDMKEAIGRGIVMDFKAGVYTDIIADLLSVAILKENSINLTPDTVLINIPSSTAMDNNKRFGPFCRLLSENLGIVDGFPYIEHVIERNNPKTSVSNMILLMESDIIRDRDILLVDDVITSGTSLKQMSDYLKGEGARGVTGVFLGKTTKRYRA